MEWWKDLRSSWRSWLLACACGGGAYLFSSLLKIATADPLLLSLGLGILINAGCGGGGIAIGSRTVARWLLPVGTFFYALVNLDLAAVSRVPGPTMVLVVVSLSVCLLGIVGLGRYFGQRRQITALLATGSAVCGASAIAMTAPSIGGEPEDVSISLLAVSLIGVLELYILFPFCGVLLNLSREHFGVMAGALLPLTGFVREGASHVAHLSGTTSPEAVVKLALLVKATRFFALIITVPLFASLLKRRMVFPLALWLYIAGGAVGYWVRLSGADWSRALSEPLYLFLWSTAMAAIGMGVNLRALVSDQGYRAFAMVLGGLLLSLLTFLSGLALLNAAGMVLI